MPCIEPSSGESTLATTAVAGKVEVVETAVEVGAGREAFLAEPHEASTTAPIATRAKGRFIVKAAQA